MHTQRVYLQNDFKIYFIIRHRFDEEANMQIFYFCENMILRIIAGVESHCENKKIMSFFKFCLV